MFIIYALHDANVDPSHESMWRFKFYLLILHSVIIIFVQTFLYLVCQIHCLLEFSHRQIDVFWMKIRGWLSKQVTVPNIILYLLI